jgi:hypothetical protein
VADDACCGVKEDDARARKTLAQDRTAMGSAAAITGAARSWALEASCEPRLPQRRSPASGNPPDTLVDPQLRLV